MLDGLISRLPALLYLTLFTTLPRHGSSTQDSLEPIHVYIEAGFELHLDCIVTDAVRIGNLTAEDIVWHHSSSPLPLTLYSAVNDTLSHLSFNVTFDDSGDYSCMLPGNSTDALVNYVVHVGLKPQSVRLECIVRKPDDFYWCRWEERENTHLPTVHTFQYKRRGRSWKSCRDLTSKGNNTCFITQAQNEGGKQVVRVTSVNKLGRNSSWKSFWSNQDVVVNPPRFVALRPGTEETSLKIRWNRPGDWYITEANKLVYKIRFKERECVAINRTCCCWDEIETTCTQSQGEGYTEEQGLCAYTLRNLEPYTNYIVQVAARYEDSKYWSVWTKENSSLTRETEPSEPVQGLTVINQTDNAEDPVYQRDVYLAWEVLEAEFQNGPILNYQVSAEAVDDTDSISIHHLISNETTCTLKGLRKYSSYVIYVRARNSAGMGPEATKSIADRTTAPNAPDDVTAVPLTTTDILVKWKEPSQPNGYILGYIVQWRKSNTNGQMEQYTTHNASRRSHVLEGLETYALYEVSVKANNSRGSGGAAYVHRGARTLQGVPNAAPSLKVKPSSNLPGSLMLTWELLPADNIQGVLKGYFISYCKINISGCSVRHHNLTRPERTTFTLTGLDPSTNYTVWIAAYTEVGIGPDSNHVNAVTGGKGLGVYITAFALLVLLLIVTVVVAICIWKNSDCLFRPIPDPKYGKNVKALKDRTATNSRRPSSRPDKEQFDEIATEVIPEFQTLNELFLPDIHLKKFIRSESGDSGVPQSPASDTLDFDAIRDKSGVSEGEDSVFLGEDQEDEGMGLPLPSEKLTVRIGRVEEGATQPFPRGATSPSSPIESVGSYTQVGEFQFSIKKSSSSSTLRSMRKVSFDLPEVGPALTIREQPSEAKGNDTKAQSDVLATPGNTTLRAPEDVSPSSSPQKAPAGPSQLTCPETGSITARRSSSLHNAEASVATSPFLPPNSTHPVSPYMTTFETEMFLYPCKQEKGHSRQLGNSTGCAVDSSRNPNQCITSVASTCKSQKYPDEKDASKIQEQIADSVSDCRRDCLNPTSRPTSSLHFSEVDTPQATCQDGYTSMSAISEPRQQNTATLQQSQVSTADVNNNAQLSKPSQSLSLAKLKGNNLSPHSPYTHMSPVHLNREHDTFEGTDKSHIGMDDRDGFEATSLQFSSSSGDQLNPYPLVSTTQPSPSPQVLPYIKIESLGTAQRKSHNDDPGLTRDSSQSPDAPSEQQHSINLTHIQVDALKPRREREDHKQPPDDTKVRKSIPHKTDTSKIDNKMGITKVSDLVLTPSGYVQASFTRSNPPAVSTHQVAVIQSHLQSTLPPGTSSTSDPEDDVQDYWKVSAPVSAPGSVLAVLQAQSDSDISDYTRTGRGTTSLSVAQTSMGYVQ